MRIRMLTVIASVLAFSASLFADSIESPKAKAIMQECPLLAPIPEGAWRYNQNSQFSEAQSAGNAESSKTSGSNEPFLWGLRGFALTFFPGLVGLVIGDQGGQIDERIEKSLSYGTVGVLSGAACSLILSLVASKHELYIGPTFIGDLIGLGTLSLVAVAMYPEIIAILLLEFVLLPSGLLF